MKQLKLILLSGVLIITACAQTLVDDLSTPRIPATETNTLQNLTSTPLPSKTPRERANEPTSTPRPPTPLPTISTFTLTFDASTIVTLTPARKAACPKEDPSVVANFPTPDSYGSHEIYSTSDILDYLNSGGTLAQLEKSGWANIVDLTGDGLKEVVYKGFASYAILGCKDGNYQDFFDFAGDFDVYLADVLDLNKNGILELILYDVTHYGFVDVYIFEWDGNNFHALIDMGTDTSIGIVIDAVSATVSHELIDTNEDGLKEIIVVYNVKDLCGGFGDFCDGTPARKQTTTLGWNGQNYIAQKQETYSPPFYRFQAIQDGDQQARDGNYATALSFYQAAIFDDRLEWWSPKRKEYEIGTFRSQFEATPTIYPTPNPDITEYPRLAAYAYYRIMLLHIVQGHESDAGTVYKTLQQKFSNDPQGHPYVEMATAFWDAYQSAHNMYDGCATAIQYAAEHPEILIPLGSDYHGRQSHTYAPADVCPFR